MVHSVDVATIAGTSEMVKNPKIIYIFLKFHFDLYYIYKLIINNFH